MDKVARVRDWQMMHVLTVGAELRGDLQEDQELCGIQTLRVMQGKA